MLAIVARLDLGFAKANVKCFNALHEPAQVVRFHEYCLFLELHPAGLTGGRIAPHAEDDVLLARFSDGGQLGERRIQE